MIITIIIRHVRPTHSSNATLDGCTLYNNSELLTIYFIPSAFFVCMHVPIYNYYTAVIRQLY